MSGPLLTEKTVIWEGRFQPVHKGHLRYIERLLDTGREVLVYMVHNEHASDEQLEAGPMRFFSEEVNKHHGNEKNPLPFGIRYKMLCDAVRSYFGDEPRLYIWGGRRMDLVWDYIKIMLPSRRVFFTPTRDAFEDIKARAWAVLGEEVVRVDTSDIEKISATMVREAAGRGESLDKYLMKCTIKTLTENDLLNSL